MTTQRDYYDILGARARGQRRRHQARLPQAGPAMAPRRQPGRRSRRPVQGDQRGVPGPLGPTAPAGVRHVRAGRAGGFGRLRPIRRRRVRSLLRPLRRLLRRRHGGAGGARRGRPAVGSDLRYDLRITFEESIRGAEKEIEFPVLDRCQTCSGTGAAAGTAPEICPQCGGRGEIRHARQTMLGQMVNVVTCPRCRGEGKVVESPCPDCGGDGRRQRQKRLRVSVPAGIDDGHQIRLSAEGEVGPRGGSAGQPLRRDPRRARTPTCDARGPSCTTSWRCRSPRRPSARPCACRRPTARRISRSSPEPSPGPSSGCGAAALPTCAARAPAGDLHVLVDVAIPTKLNREQREALEAYAEASGETNVGSARGGVLDRIKDALG